MGVTTIDVWEIRMMQFDGGKAAGYARSRFNEKSQLCCESIRGEYAKTFWLMNDNGLAVVLFDRLGEIALRDKIIGRLRALSELTVKTFGHEAFRNQGWVDPFIHRGIYYLEPLRRPQCYRCSNGKFDGPFECQGGMEGTVHEEWNGSPYWDEEAYPNLSASKALSWHKQYKKTGNTKDREKRDFFVRSLESLWDAANLGFRRPKQKDEMTTYYLAAYLLVGEKTGWPAPFDANRRALVRNMLDSLQLQSGGYATWYVVKNGKVVAHDYGGNTETTSLAVYSSIRPQEYCDFH